MDFHFCMFFYSFRAFTVESMTRVSVAKCFHEWTVGGRKKAVLQKPPVWDSVRWEFFLLKRSKLFNQKSHIDAFKNDYKSKGYHLKYQQQLLLCKIPPIPQLMNFCQTSSVFSDPLDLLDHPLLLDIFFRGAPQLRAGVGFYFFTKCPLRNTQFVPFKLCYCALEIDLNKIRLVFTCKWSQL